MGNLRHSHIWLGYGPQLSFIFSSPAMHQLHHSCKEEHLDKNFGLNFSIWDWMAGSLYIPKERVELELGLKDGAHLGTILLSLGG